MEPTKEEERGKGYNHGKKNAIPNHASSVSPRKLPFCVGNGEGIKGGR